MLPLVLPSFHDDLGLFIFEHYVKHVFEGLPALKRNVQHVSEKSWTCDQVKCRGGL